MLTLVMVIMKSVSSVFPGGRHRRGLDGNDEENRESCFESRYGGYPERRVCAARRVIETCIAPISLSGELPRSASATAS